MPSETFLCLKKEKKEMITAILLDEFYAQHVSQVKVAAIVCKAKISRGAFYKYFHNLEDAYAYTVKECSKQIHGDIFRFIAKDKNDFFAGVEGYLSWCAQCAPNDSNWKKIKLCTQSGSFSRTKRESLAADSPMLRQWLALLKENQFTITETKEAVSFLYFVMALVMDSLTDFITNDWQAAQLIEDFRYKVQWIQHGVK